MKRVKYIIVFCGIFVAYVYYCNSNISEHTVVAYQIIIYITYLYFS